jgi:hypothetical protein
LQHIWSLALVLDLCIGVCGLELRHGDAIEISRRTAGEAENLPLADYFDHIEDGAGYGFT